MSPSNPRRSLIMKIKIKTAIRQISCSAKASKGTRLIASIAKQIKFIKERENQILGKSVQVGIHFTGGLVRTVQISQ